MKYGSKHTRRIKKYVAPLLQYNSYLLSIKSSVRLLSKRQKDYYPYNYPLLITSGLQRSGTHLVDNLLRNHPQTLSYYGELQIGRPNKYHWPDLEDIKDKNERFAALMPKNLARNFLTLTKYRKSGKAYEDFIFDFRFFRKIFLALEEKNINLDQRTTLNNFFTAYFNAYLNCNHSSFYDQYKYIVAPVPGLIIFKTSIEKFFKDYPDGKIFILIRDPLIWWNSARNHTKNLKNNGLERYKKTLAHTIWASDQFKDRVFAVSFDQLIKNSEKSARKIATYPSRFPFYANDNSTFGHKPTNKVLKDKVKRTVRIPEKESSYIEAHIFPLYKKVIENHIINPSIS